MVSKSDIKKALLEKYEVIQENLLKEKTVVYVDASIDNIPLSVVRERLVIFIGEYFTRMGHDLKKAGGATFQTDTAKLLSDDLKKTMRHIRISEVRLAMEYGAKGVFGEAKHCSVSTIEDYLMKYLQLPERAMAKDEIKKEENERNNAKLLAQRTEWTAEDHSKAMRGRYIENLNRIDQGKEVLDYGGLLFDHMLKVGVIEVTEDDKKEVMEKLNQLHNQNKWDPRFKDQMNSLLSAPESMHHPLVREHVLTKYFKMEVAMRLEARELEKKQNEQNPSK